MTTRRNFLAGLIATGLAPAPTWADAGGPTFLTAARTVNGDHVLVGLRADLSEAFRLPLPTRGHAAAAHPVRPEAVTFARRPGTFALIINCQNGTERARIQAPEGRHFYGHGVFSSRGDLLFTTENDFENARGVVGVWDVRKGYRRIDEFGSGGVGPHEIALMRDARTLVIANGGIETHPESGRAKLNIPMMRPNLSYCSLDGALSDTSEPPHGMHRNSIRHLTIGSDGAVYFAMQWQGERQDTAPLAGVHRPGSDMAMFQADTKLWRQMQGYAGSIAASEFSNQVAVTSPRGNLAAIFDTDTRKVINTIALNDVCGVTGTAFGFAATTGSGLTTSLDLRSQRQSDLAYDNHLLRL